MKLSKKLNFAVFAVVVGLGVSIGLLTNTVMNARGLQELQDATRIAIRESNAVLSITQRFMYTGEEVAPILEEYYASLDASQEAMTVLAEHPQLWRLPEQLRRNISASEAMWNQMAGRQLTEVGDEIEILINSDIPGVEGRPGIYPIQLEAGDDLPIVIRNSLQRAERRINQAATVAGGFLDETLNEVASVIASTSAAIVDFNLRISLAVASVVALLSVLVIMGLARSLTRRVGGIEGAMREMAQRNFDVEAAVSGRDELADLGGYVRQVRDAVSEFFRAVREATNQTLELQDNLGSSTEEASSALNQISRNIEGIRDQFTRLNDSISTTGEAVRTIDGRVQELSGDIDSQSQQVDTVFSSIEEMNAGVQNVTHLSADRMKRVESVRETVSEGAEKVRETNDIVQSVSREVDDMLEIIEIINAISEQTHLLSMNAAIESAHAGAVGNGFAVVADEIGKLADSTSENASRIESNLKRVTGEIERALSASETSNESFVRVEQEVGGFADAMSEISGSMQQLSQGSREILDSTAEVSRITGRIKEGAQEMLESASEIRKAMDDADNVSSDVANGVKEIDQGAKEILESMNATNDMSVQNREQLDKLDRLLATFRAAEVSEDLEVDAALRSDGASAGGEG